MTAQHAEAIQLDQFRTAREIDELADRLRPRVNRGLVLERLDAAFRAGTAPDPLPDGFLAGRLLTTSVWGPLDRGVMRLARVWTPWQGKTFDRLGGVGVNRFKNGVANRAAMRAIFPGYRPERVTVDLIEAFPMRNRVEPGALDPGVDVFKIDYDFEANPPLIRRILDEMVQVAPGRYLGKVLLRARGRFHPIGFFTLSSL